VEFLLFAGVGVIGLGLNTLFIYILTDIFFVKVMLIPGKQLRILVSKIISGAFVYIWNFTARKISLFR
jgi:putative flippase GtrA